MSEPAFIYLCKKLTAGKNMEGLGDGTSREKIYSRYAHSEQKEKKKEPEGEGGGAHESAMKRAERAFFEMKDISSEIKEAYQNLMKSNS